MKQCTLCKKSFEATLENFGPFKEGKNGLHSRCRQCEKDRKRKWSKKNEKRLKDEKKKYYQDNKKEILKKQKQYYQKNKEYINKRQAIYENRNKDKIREYKKLWARGNSYKRTEYARNKYRNDPIFRLKSCLRARLTAAVAGKSASTMELIGCSIDELKHHLESKFTDGMSWDNYGEWHVDHIKPCASFDLSDPKQQRLCFNYKNLQPLWASENLKKGCSY